MIDALVLMNAYKKKMFPHWTKKYPKLNIKKLLADDATESPEELKNLLETLDVD